MDSNNRENIYKELRKTYTDEEIVEYFVLPSSRTKEERAEMRRKVREYVDKQKESELE